MEPEALEDALASVAMFAPAPRPVLRALAEAGRMAHLPAGAVVCREGEPSDCMFLVLEGEVRVSREDAGHAVELARLAPGELLGELGVLDGAPRSATAVCVTACALFELPKAEFMARLASSGSVELLGAVLATIAGRVRQTSQQLFDKMLAERTLQAEMEAERHRALGELVAGVAHELNTPLGVANTGASLLERAVQQTALADAAAASRDATEALEDILEAAELVRRNIARAHRLVESFKSVSVGHFVDRRETVDLRRAVDEVVDLFRVRARDARIAVEIDDRVPAGRGGWTGYPGRLGQVLTNLLLNVERHAFPHGEGGRTRVELSATDEGFVLAVRDDGVGVPAALREQIFAPFFTTARDRGGAGLGLAIVRNLVVDGLGGRIEVESSAGEGTCFRVLLPREAP
ncbi:MAG: cyclic nucleotide-binding domain-containing protein [Myxococcales bacterium]|nr:cyclic nucleotide-binding domain-containing protein [Myxococcales bacterium]